MTEDLDVESTPTDDQKERLENFLTELMLLSRKYRILLMDEAETVEILDVPSQHVIGVGLGWFIDDGRVKEYVPVDSILDGAWPMEVGDAVTEQRFLQNVYPHREPPA